MIRKQFRTWSRSLPLIALIALASACGGDDGDDGVDPNLPEVDCATVPAYGELNLVNFCTGCHSSTLPASMRSAAPVGVDYDNYDVSVASAERGVVRVFANTMPPGGAGVIAEADREAFYNWALCGTPE